jgi:hypothetical protein
MEIAGLLSSPLGKTVVNETGISGTFNVDLRFAPEGAELSKTVQTFWRLTAANLFRPETELSSRWASPLFR